jgi:hypothetical protein
LIVSPLFKGYLNELFGFFLELTKLESVIRPLVEGIGLKLYDLEFQGRVLRVTIDGNDGVSLEDCAQVSRLLDPVLDVEGFGLDAAGAEDPNAMTITIDLQGVSGDAVENVNVQLDGKPIGGEADVDVDDMAGGEEMSVDMAAGAGGDEDEMMVVAEVRRLVREQMEALGLKTNKKATPAKPAAKPAAKPQAVNEVAELTKQLDETRVLTARSLFLNKILVSEASLTESQRRKIVEYLDAGNTVNEVKEIYGKIVKAINKNKAKAAAPAAGSLNESANINGKQIRQVSDLMSVPMFDADRWSKLAGIGKGR